MRGAIFAFAAVMSLTTGAQAENTATTADAATSATATAPVAADPNEVICHMERVMGTLIPSLTAS